jgi:DNA-binding winged helix-turn-helix (wHTH) protein
LRDLFKASRKAGFVPEKKVRFDDFVLDFGRFQLCRGGQLVRLEGLPLQLLMFLIEQKGLLVTREQIASQLWGNDVFVDVEQGINTAIRKVRIALEDDSDQPQYLQTVVGRGYRFIAPTSTDEDASSAVSAPNQPSVVSFEELGRAIMTAAGIDPDIPRPTPKPPDES